MMKYLTILLDDTSVSFCHADNPFTSSELMPLDVLKKGIMFAMKENLSIQFVYPEYPLPQEYIDVIETIDHINVESSRLTVASDVVVIDDPSKFGTYIKQANFDTVYILRCRLQELFALKSEITESLKTLKRISIIIRDVEEFSDDIAESYQNFLNDVSEEICAEFNDGHSPQINILTDRLFLDNANHCNAGVESITLSPKGDFYICPSFYYDEHADKGSSLSVGNIDTGISIKNAQLFDLKHAPICRVCDAYHCKRCVWLNKHLTREVNTPSRQQCVMSHIERNCSREIQNAIQSSINMSNIPVIDYLDPLDHILQNK